MKKQVWRIAAVTAVMVLFAGCPNPGTTANDDDDNGDTVPVSSIQILIGGQAASGSQTLIVGETKSISARVLPNDTTEDKGFTLDIGDTAAEVATLGDDGTLNATGKGAFTLTATSVGKNAQGDTVKAVLQFTVKVDPQNAPLAFTVFDQKTRTSSALPQPNGNGRIEIVNDYADASFNGPEPGASTGNGWVRNNTFVYLQRPLKIQPKTDVGPDDEAWVPYGIRARMRISEAADDIANADNANMGVVIAIMTDPQDAADARHYFVGLRSSLNGQKRGFRGRAADTSSGSLTGFVAANNPLTSITNAKLANEMDRADSVADKTAGYREQEYIYEVIRLRDNYYLIRMYEPDGTEIFTGRMDNSNGIFIQMQDADAYLYLGFMVAGVKVEIADIEITEGDQALLAPIAANPPPYADVPNRLRITTPDSNPVVQENVAYNYAGPLAVLENEGGHQLAAAVYPLSVGVSPDVTWSSSDETVATVDSAGLVTFKKGGSVTITAVSNADNTKTHAYSYYITEGAVNVATITIAGDSEVLQGFEAKLEAEIAPLYATNKDVTWSVKAGSESILEVDSDGWVKGLTTGTGYIVAAADDGGGAAGEYAVQVVAIAGKTIHWNFQRVPEGWVNDGATNNATTVYYRNNMTLTAATRVTRINTKQTVSATAAIPASIGCIQPNGGGKWAAIADVPGKFTITLYYTDTGGSQANPPRYPKIHIDGEEVGELPAGNGSAVTEAVYTCDSDTDVTVELDGSGALRYYDVFITFN